MWENTSCKNPRQWTVFPKLLFLKTFAYWLLLPNIYTGIPYNTLSYINGKCLINPSTIKDVLSAVFLNSYSCFDESLSWKNRTVFDDEGLKTLLDTILFEIQSERYHVTVVRYSIKGQFLYHITSISVKISIRIWYLILWPAKSADLSDFQVSHNKNSADIDSTHNCEFV